MRLGCLWYKEVEWKPQYKVYSSWEPPTPNFTPNTPLTNFTCILSTLKNIFIDYATAY